MPVYPYKCDNCGITFERHIEVEGRDDVLKEACRNCGEYSLLRTIAPCSFIIHGASAKNGYGSLIGDIEKFTGHEFKVEEDY